jgi:hypothetical protein
MNEADKFYLNYTVSDLSQLSQSRINFLGYFITLNIAFYAAIYYMGDKNIFSYASLRLILSSLLFIINTAIYIIYSRQNKLAEIEWEGFLNFIDTNAGEEIKEIRKNIKSKDVKNSGLFWETIKFLLSIFCAIPVAYLLTILLNMVFPSLTIAFALVSLSCLYYLYYKEITYCAVLRLKEIFNK